MPPSGRAGSAGAAVCAAVPLRWSRRGNGVSAVELYLRLAGATALLLLPGALLAQSLGLGGLSPALVLSLAAGDVQGDGLFHLGRIRKLMAFDSLHLRTVDEFRDGGLHPGYAFPLWHVLLALVGRLAAVDPSAVLLHQATVLVPLAFVLAYEAGAAVFRSAWGGLAALLPQVALIAIAPGRGGAYT